MPDSRRPLECRSNADARAFNTVPIEVKARDEFTCGFCDSVNAIRPEGILCRHVLVTLVVADNMVGARVNDTGPGKLCRTENVGRSENVGSDQLLRRRLEANSAEMNDGGGVPAKFSHGTCFGEVSAHEFGVLGLARHFASVAQAELESAPGQSGHEPGTDFACRTRDDDHTGVPSSNSNVRTPGERASQTSKAPSSGCGTDFKAWLVTNIFWASLPPNAHMVGELTGVLQDSMMRPL